MNEILSTEYWVGTFLHRWVGVVFSMNVILSVDGWSGSSFTDRLGLFFLRLITTIEQNLYCRSVGVVFSINRIFTACVWVWSFPITESLLQVEVGRG